MRHEVVDGQEVAVDSFDCRTGADSVEFGCQQLLAMELSDLGE